MSTLQRATLDTAADPMDGARLLMARTDDTTAAPPEDIAALRLRVLAARFAGTDTATFVSDKEKSLADADAEFEPVSLAAIVARGRKQAPDTPGDSLIAPRDVTTAAAAPFVAIASAPTVPLPAETDDSAAATPDLVGLPVPLQLADEATLPSAMRGEIIQDSHLADETDDPEIESEVSITTPSAANEPLMLADQSGPDIRLIDLIRRQQTLLDQLNRFPPAYDTLENAAASDPAATNVPSLSVIDQLAPPSANTAAPALDIGREAPPPLPPPGHDALPPPSQKPPSARERKDEPSEPALPEQSPIIIQRARAERSGRRLGPALAAPPSVLPAFFVGLGVAVVIAGVLLAVL
jgi:hypothetical protein